MRRVLIEAADEALDIAWTPPDLAGALDAITSKFSAIERRQVSKAPRSIADIAQERLAHHTAFEEGTVIAGWRTGIAWLDSALNGGLRPGGLNVLAARPSVGKSSFSQSLASSTAADGLPTLFLSMEMGGAEVADRGVASAGRISYSALLTGKASPDHWQRGAGAGSGTGSYGAGLTRFLERSGGRDSRDQPAEPFPSKDRTLKVQDKAPIRSLAAGSELPG